MPLSLEKLEKILRHGDLKAVPNFFKGATEPERRIVAPTVTEWCRRLKLNWRAQFKRKGAAEVEKAGPIKNWHELMPAAHTAALASLDLAEIKSLQDYDCVPADFA